jgi:hypothetical protein
MKVSMIGTIVLLAAVAANLQASTPSDEGKILQVVAEARAQIDSWVDALVFELDNDMLTEKVDIPKATKLLDRIKLEEKNEKTWESTLWTIPHSELLSGELIQGHYGTFLMIAGTGATCHKRFPDMPERNKCDASETNEAMYIVEAPLDAKAHILMEAIRQGISHYAAIEDFRGKSTSENAFVLSWNSAWFDARNVYCRHSPGTKYLDLSNDEQTCKSGN